MLAGALALAVTPGSVGEGTVPVACGSVGEAFIGLVGLAVWVGGGMVGTVWKDFSALPSGSMRVSQTPITSIRARLTRVMRFFIQPTFSILISRF
jgi:hypothetical protein